MKICIIGFPRSRSSLLLETISIYYNIPLLGEDINSIESLIPKRDWLNDITLPSPPEPYYKSLQLLLKKNNRKGEGVIRFHPLQLSFMPYSVGMIDFNLCDFSQYDRIYFTVRNHVDTIASLFVAEQLNTYTYQSKDAVYKQIDKMSITDLKTVYEHIYSELVANKLKEFLTSNNIKFTELDYDDIPSYITQVYPSAASSHVETNYDYKSIIDNYDAIDKLYRENYAPVAQLVEAALSKGV